ncbi:Crp/Fnr family transcriptional regulator [Flavicella sediminum]|uniref:Crp/Fnr family transcriptional regulator n=1 Tax=Flavicella sediminum TaxID=2585141 RepID=UPI001120C2C7|nr:Crp/Fnr family transcriptional regulator [Flavicella sediminum]
MEEFVKTVNLISPISQESWLELSQISTVIDVPKKTKLNKIGEYPHSFYFMISGNARGYINTSNNTEYNKALFTENMFFGALAALVKNTNSRVAYETLTNSRIVKINFRKFIELVETREDINLLYIKLLETIFLRLEQRDIEMVTLDATERYLKLKERLPNIDKEISLYQIASNLGITAIQLSRIRKKLLFKK